MFTDIKDIEKAIIKKYRKEIWIPFIEAVNEFNLIEENDKIAVCISGGKDSLILAKVLQEIQRHGKKKFELKFISMDPGFNKANRDELEFNCKHLEIPVIIKESNIFSITDNIAKEQPCYLCARMRRGFLYNFAKELGCNKIALGHHMDDVIETTMMNVFYAGCYKTMMPKLHSTNFENMELIRPLYYVKEHSIVKFKNYTGLHFMDCGCSVTAEKRTTKRKEIKELIKVLQKTHKDIDKSILKSASNVHLDAVLGYKSNDIKYNFLDFYDNSNLK